MIKIQKYYTILLLILLVLLTSCSKEETFPPEPSIKYLSFTRIPLASGVDDKGVLKIYFTDGDGDIGLTDADTMPPFDRYSDFYYNFFIKYYEKQKGVYVPVELPVSFNSRIPVINPEGKSKALKGEIEIELFINNPFSLYDTIMFEAYIVDRALHASNIVATPDIIIRKF